VYDEIHLLHQPIGDKGDAARHVSTTLQNRNDILNFLRFHKLEPRFVPKPVDDGDNAALKQLCDAVSDWITAQAAPVAVGQIQDLFSGNLKPQSISPEQKKVEEKFQADNFDLINWFIITN
jgi:hypothetical protein